MDQNNDKNFAPKVPSKRDLRLTEKFDPKPPNEIKELHVCMGLNSCKGNGFLGTNDCAGKGSCATVVHACHTVNDCRGQGGCGLFGTAPEFCHPGENNCKYQGSCGSPVMASRFIVDGPNQGLSVWQLARQRFEERMKKEGKSYGEPPKGQPYGPTPEYTKSIGQYQYESCGQSGSRYCSYKFGKAANEADKKRRREEFEKHSAETGFSNKGCE